jgi:hypothetical protein
VTEPKADANLSDDIPFLKQVDEGVKVRVTQGNVGLADKVIDRLAQDILKKNEETLFASLTKAKELKGQLEKAKKQGTFVNITRADGSKERVFQQTEPQEKEVQKAQKAYDSFKAALEQATNGDFKTLNKLMGKGNEGGGSKDEEKPAEEA